MKLKKRNTRSRLRGSRRAGYGFGKKHRGKGTKGGKGMAGTGKKAGQKLTWVQAKFPDYFGKKGFTSRQQLKSNIKVINLDEIHDRIETLAKKGKAKKTSSGIEIDLKGYKVLGRGNVKEKLIISASSASQSAKESIEKAGGKIIIPNQQEKKEVKKKEKRE